MEKQMYIKLSPRPKDQLLLSTSDLLLELAFDLRRRRRLKRVNGKIYLSQNRVAGKLEMTVSTFQRMESDDYMSMNLGDFIKMLQVLEDNNINTEL
jgi:hypothetical protein